MQKGYTGLIILPTSEKAFKAYKYPHNCLNKKMSSDNKNVQ